MCRVDSSVNEVSLADLPDLPEKHVIEYSEAERSMRQKQSALKGPVPVIIYGFGGGGHARVINSDAEMMLLEKWAERMETIEGLLRETITEAHIPLLTKGDASARRELPDTPSASGLEDKKKSQTMALLNLQKGLEAALAMLGGRIQRLFDSATDACTNRHEYEQFYLRGLHAKLAALKRKNEDTLGLREAKRVAAEKAGKADYLQKMAVIHDKNLIVAPEQVQGKASSYLELLRARRQQAANAVNPNLPPPAGIHDNPPPHYPPPQLAVASPAQPVHQQQAAASSSPMQQVR